LFSGKDFYKRSWLEDDCAGSREVLEVLPFWLGSIRVVSINGNNPLITVAGDIVEERKYPS